MPSNRITTLVLSAWTMNDVDDYTYTTLILYFMHGSHLSTPSHLPSWGRGEVLFHAWERGGGIKGNHKPPNSVLYCSLHQVRYISNIPSLPRVQRELVYSVVRDSATTLSDGGEDDMQWKNPRSRGSTYETAFPSHQPATMYDRIPKNTNSILPDRRASIQRRLW